VANKFIEFEQEVEAIIARAAAGEISQAERDTTLRQMRLQDKQWGDTWIISPKREWFRKARGSDKWIRDYPLELIDPATLPPVARMSLPQLARAVHDCTRCPLHQSRSRGVPGEGPPQADIMLIGEAPGFNEDKQGRPFVGAAGQFLDELLGYAGYKREDVFITNIIKSRPPNNRDPDPEEITACQAYLERQIELVKPKVIVTLGRYSMYRYFPGASISRIHGQPQRLGQRLVVPMLHPAAALHQPQWRSLIIEDFRKLPELIKEAASFEPDSGIDPTNAEQLSLF
jgi:uracil-DNA glycosylase family 4